LNTDIKPVILTLSDPGGGVFILTDPRGVTPWDFL